MRGLIEEPQNPILLCDTHGIVTDKNRRAAYSVLPIKKGGQIKRFLCGDSAMRFETMKPGEVRAAEVSLPDISGTVMARFSDYFYLSFHLFPISLASSLTAMSAYTEETARELMQLSSETSARANKTAILEQKGLDFLRNQLNISRLLNIIISTRSLKIGVFDPAAALSLLNKYTEETLSKNGIKLVCGALPVGVRCLGNEEDFYSTLALMLAISAEYSLDKKVQIDGRLVDKKFFISFIIKNSMPSDLTEEICRDETQTFDSHSKPGAFNTPLMVNSLFIKHVSEKSGWFARIQSPFKGRLQFLLSLPASDETITAFREDEKRRAHLNDLIQFQLAPLM